MRRAAVAVALLVAVAACSDDPGTDVGTGEGPTTTATTSVPPGEPVAITVDCAPFADDIRGLVTSQELVFDGTVVATSVEPNPDARHREAFVDDGHEDPDGFVPDESDPPPAEAWPWTTFAVDAWWSQDFGAEISIWTAGLDVEPGERWLIAGEAFAGPTGQSGMAAACASQPWTSEGAAAWDEWFGGSVAAGGDEPEGSPDPAVVAAVEEGRTRWEANEPAVYAVALSLDTTSTYSGDCGAGPLLVVVEDGEAVAAVDESAGCTVDLDVVDVPTVDDLFDAALVAAGATDGDVAIDPTWGYVSSFYGYDRAVDLAGGVAWFAPGDHELLVGDEIAAALPDLQGRWAGAGIDDYRFVVEPLCFCGLSPITVTVTDGVGSFDGADADFLPTSVDEAFAAVADEVASSDLVVAAFDAGLGYPARIVADRLRNAIDDELTLTITGFTPG